MNLELNIENKDWKFKRYDHDFNDVHYVFTFDNGYSASIIKNKYSYGGDKDLWELAVLKDGDLCYDTPITDDVIGYLTDKEVNELLRRIEQLEGEQQ